MTTASSNGVLEEFSSTGKLMRHSEYAHGQPHGWQRRYRDDGKHAH